MTGKFLKFFTAILFLASFTLILGNIKRIISSTTPDFSVLWLSARDLATGVDPYLDPRAFTPNGYPPVSHIFYIPLAFLNFGTAHAVFLLISFAATVGAVYLSIKIAGKKVKWQNFLLFLGLVFLSFPFKFTLGMGQINAVVLFLLLLGFYLDGEKKYIRAGVILGISIALKPLFAFFLLFFALTKSWKVIWTGLITVFLSISSALILWGPTPWISWIKIGILPLSNFAGRETYYNQGLMGFISRLSGDLNIRKYLSGIISILLVILASLFTIKKTDRNLVFSFFITTLLLIDTLSWQHHFVWLIFPFIVLIHRALKSKKAVLSALIMLAYLLVSWNFKNPVLYSGILLSNQFYGAMILWGINLYLIIASKELPNPSR